MTQKITMVMSAVCMMSLLFTATVSTAACPPDSAQVGPTCVDKYEVSVWQIPTVGNQTLISKVQRGRATLSDLTSPAAVARGVGLLFGVSNEPCHIDGNATCDELYAVSVAGVRPTPTVSWFQAQQICLNSGKRLLTNAEWQGAAAETPDPGTDNGTTDCNVQADAPGEDPVNTGSRANCVSRWGVHDMVGNLEEFVADWVPRSTNFGSTLVFGTGDTNCLAGATDSGPSVGVITRGGAADLFPTHPGVFNVCGLTAPTTQFETLGFRCGR